MSTIIISGREIPAIYIAIALPVLAGVYVAMAAYGGDENLSTRLAALDAQRQSVSDKTTQTEQLAEKTKEIDQIKAETQALQKSITLLKQKIPAEAQVPVLLYDIERIAKASQGTMKSFQPGELRQFGSGEGSTGTEAASNSATGDIMEMPVTIQASGTYPEVIKFLSQVSNYERKLNVSNLKLSPNNSSEGTGGSGKESIVFKNGLNVEFTLSAYILKAGGAQP